MSLPWKVGDASNRRAIAWASGLPSDLAAGTRRPLSGPTKRWPPLLITIPSRLVPTAGSTTARWTVPEGKCLAVIIRAKAPALMS